MKRYLALLVGFACAAPALATGFIDQLPAEKVRAAGLDKLTSEERAELEKLIEAHQRGELAQMKEDADRKIAAAEAKAKAAQEARVAENEETSASGKRPAWITALITLKAAESAENQEAVTTRIAGDYKGWSGHTTFRLENGQIWQQVDGGTRVDSVRQSPAVKIYPGMLGVYWMEIEGVRQRLKVKPIRLE